MSLGLRVRLNAPMDQGFGSSIARLLESRHQSQKWLAQQMDVSTSTISRLVSARSNPTAVTIARVLAALGATWHDWAAVVEGEAPQPARALDSELGSVRVLLEEIVDHLRSDRADRSSATGRWNAGVRAVLQERGWEIADAADRAGMARSVLADMVGGRDLWNLAQMERFSAAAGLSIEEVLALGEKVAAPQAADAIIRLLGQLSPGELARIRDYLQEDADAGGSPG